MTDKKKTGRNDPCPCGSLKDDGTSQKYKKCCLKKEEELKEVVRKAQQEMAERTPEPFEKGGFITGRPFISEVAQGKRWRAVGNTVYTSPVGETFHQFLLIRLSAHLTQEWFENEKKSDSPHQIVQWYLETEEIIKSGEKEKAKNAESIKMTGNVRSLLSLAYDFYSLEHCGAKVQPKLLNRLKNKTQFQGAKYEIAAAATVCRAGFVIKWLPDDGTKHGEFTGKHKVTGFEAVFEAKSHHRGGVLGKDGEFNGEIAKTKITDHVREAIDQTNDSGLPLIVFDDLNLPLTAGVPTNEKTWFKEIDGQLKKYGFMEKEEYKKCKTLVITNFSWHFHYDVPPDDNEQLIFFWTEPDKKLPETILNFVIPAVKQYGHVPALLYEMEKIDEVNE